MINKLNEQTGVKKCEIEKIEIKCRKEDDSRADFHKHFYVANTIFRSVFIFQHIHFYACNTRACIYMYAYVYKIKINKYNILYYVYTTE